MKVSNTKVGGSTGLDATDRTQGNRKSDAKDLNGVNKIASNTSEKVNLSSRVQDMQKIKETAMTGKDSIDEAKVARLQAMIDKGEYKVDAEAIADRLVDEHLNMPT